MVCKGNLVANWEFFRQQWEDYEVATGLDKQSSKIRLASLRSVMGKDCLQTFLNLNISAEDRNNVEACMAALENYFKPQRNVVYERYVFNSCEQNQGESVDSYVTRLRKFASSCEFGTLTDELIRDKLVICLNDRGTKGKLLREKSRAETYVSKNKDSHANSLNLAPPSSCLRCRKEDRVETTESKELSWSLSTTTTRTGSWTRG